LRAAEVVKLLGLEPMPVEGGMWCQTWRDDHGSAIYFLLRPGDFSALHRLDAPELWHHYRGSPVRMLLLEADGAVERPVLGDDLAAGERPFVAVAAGVWMGAATTGEWSLVGTTMAPPFNSDGFELGERERLAALYPAAAREIEAYIRADRP